MSGMQKLTIYSPETGARVSAGFNPKELSYDKDAGWSEDSDGFGADMQAMQFTNGKSIKISVELFFDKYESGGDVRGDVQTLLSFAMVDKKLQRPPIVTILWGRNIVLSSSELMGVVQSVNTKYTMFLPNGTPCRATCTVSFVQAREVSVKGESSTTTTTVDLTPKECNSDQTKQIVDQGGDPVEDFNQRFTVSSSTSTKANEDSSSSNS